VNYPSLHKNKVNNTILHSKNNPILGQIWTNPTVGLKKNATYKLNPTVGFVHISPKIVFSDALKKCWVVLTQLIKCQNVKYGQTQLLD